MMLLGQTLEVAEKSLGLLERMNAGGVPLIALVVATLAVLAFIWQLRKNNDIEKEWRDAGKVDGDKRLVETKDLMREMLARDKEGTAANVAAMSAVEGLSATIKEHGETERRKLDEILTRMADLERTVRTKGGA